MAQEVKKMRRKGLSQEGLKLIACVTMLIDHVGATLAYAWYVQESRAAGMSIAWMWRCYLILRMIGRTAFPIYCFLLVEGAYHTRDPKKYGMRLAVGSLLAQIPYELMVSGSVTLQSYSVMVTLLLGFILVEMMKRLEGIWKIALIVPFCILARWLDTDYSWRGILMIAMLALTKNQPREKLLRFLCFVPLLWFGGKVHVGPIAIPLQLFALPGVGAMMYYDGRKLTRNRAVQWAFYLFYPVHMMVLWGLETWLFG